MPLCAQEQPAAESETGARSEVKIGMLAPAWLPPILSDIEVEPPIRAVLRELNKSTDLRIDKMPLIELADYLTKRYKIQFRLDRVRVAADRLSPQHGIQRDGSRASVENRPRSGSPIPWDCGRA